MAEQKTRTSARFYGDLFAISFLVLFLELACIRWFASYVIFLTFFTNIVLLASFLGMSVGCLAASRKTSFINWVPWLSLLATVSAIGLLLFYGANTGMMVAVGDQTSPELVYFGTEYRHTDITTVAIPMELIGGFFFVLIALIFVGLGQVIGRRLDVIPNRILAYTTNILGSLTGIVAFALVSFFHLSPFWWFLIGLGCCCYFMSGRLRVVNWVLTGITIAFVAFTGWGVGFEGMGRIISPGVAAKLEGAQYFWSPYYGITYSANKKAISVNRIGHQQMNALKEGGLAYILPYVLSRDTHRPPIKDVVIIGAGSGNDTSAALWAGAEHIDSVEIDPVIVDLGKRYHPDQPYQDSKVSIHVNDGRNFLKSCDRQYDLVVYALVDSLVLHTGYSSIRLESFLFTRQAFQDVKERLKEDGVFVIYNYFRQGWIVGRLKHLAKDVFGKEPLVISMPYKPEITESSLEGGFTMILVGDTDRIAEAFETRGSYWVPRADFLNDQQEMGFGVNPGEKDYVEIAPATVVGSEHAKLLPNDNWPFLYLSSRHVPNLSLRGMAVIGILSLIILGIFAPKKGIRFNWTMFFLGAGFMLLETKSVVQLALLFGSTWIVNSVVFFAILVMILLSNLFVLKFRPRRLMPWYVALTISLLVNIFIGLDVFLGMPEALKIVLPCLIVFIPIFFAGVIFATIFRESTNPDMDFGSNIAGVVLGGLAEYFSMVLGFNHLLWLAIGFYLLSRLLKFRMVRRAA